MAQAAEPEVTQDTDEHSFEVGMWVVHPSHGVGKVRQIEERSLGGAKSAVYVLEVQDSSLKVMVPCQAASRVGLRAIMSSEEAEGIFAILSLKESAVRPQAWNRRQRAYTEMLSSGAPGEIAKVLRDMMRLRTEKELSYGERRLLDQATALLKGELVLALQVAPEELDARIEALFSAP